MSRSDTIFALSSAAGKAGVAVVRLSGGQAGLALQMIAGGLPKPRTAALRALRQPPEGASSSDTGASAVEPELRGPETDFAHDIKPGAMIDRALVLWFPGPNSFTGEDCAEFQVHGGKAVLATLLAALGRIADCRMALPGEFARRAFANGKLDLTQAEGLADLIDAETEAQRRQALRQAGGALAKLYESWRRELIECLALQEAGIDFSDEPDVALSVSITARRQVSSLREAIAAHLNDGNRGEILRDGFQVVLAGPPNAGKSSLLNALARRDVAIVSTEAGTTRDIIEVRLDLKGLPIVVSDTAGIRAEGETSGEIEKIGIERSIARARQGDLILWLNDGREPNAAPPVDLGITASSRDDGVPIVIVRTKADLLQETDPDGGSHSHQKDVQQTGALISVVSGAGIADLTAQIAAIAALNLSAQTGPALTQTRHRQNLEQCRHYLDIYLAGADDDTELRAEDLRQAALALGRITGHVDVEDVLDRLFSSFCIGK